MPEWVSSMLKDVQRSITTITVLVVVIAMSCAIWYLALVYVICPLLETLLCP